MNEPVSERGTVRALYLVSGSLWGHTGQMEVLLLQVLRMTGREPQAVLHQLPAHMPGPWPGNTLSSSGGRTPAVEASKGHFKLLYAGVTQNHISYCLLVLRLIPYFLMLSAALYAQAETRGGGGGTSCDLLSDLQNEDDPSPRLGSLSLG